MLGQLNHDLVFTSGGTEANNLAIHSALAAHKGQYIVTSEIEHPSVLAALSHAQMTSRREIVLVRTLVTGEIDLDHLSATLARTSGDVSLVSLMWANNESGVLQPVQKACELAHSAGALFHTDAVQAAGKIRISLASLPADYLTVSAHKFGGPMGVGAMIFPRSFRKNKPLMHDGGQEKGVRSGTENVPGIVGMGEAASLASDKLQTAPRELVRDSFELGITALFPSALVLGAYAPRVPNTSLLRIPGVNGYRLVRKLDRLGVAIATGSACHSGSISPSKSLIAMGLGDC